MNWPGGVGEVVTGTAYADRLRDDLLNARRSVTLTTYVVRAPGRRAKSTARLLWATLLAAPARDITCRIITDQSTAQRAHTRRNASAGHQLLTAGWEVRTAPRNQVLHAKTALIDGIILYVTSANLTTAALERNHEVGIRVADPRMASTLQDWLTALWQRSQP